MTHVIDDLDVPMVARQPGNGYIPAHPTDGWMRAELDALGVFTRGTPMTSAKLVAMLRARGYSVNDGPVPSHDPGGDSR